MKGKQNNELRISGGAVSLYLTAEIKHLHDLARQHPHIVCSEIYAMALRSSLGEVEAKHPMELLVENQEHEVQAIMDQLESARNRLKASTSRLPMELARAEWMRNALGRNGLAELKALRIFLFFDATVNPNLSTDRPKNGEESLSRYKELLFKYESTKNGPIENQKFQILEHLHPSHFTLENGFLCCESDESCGEHSRISTAGKYENHFEGSNIAINLCDDLKYRCHQHLQIRRAHHIGKTLSGQSITKLKPHWEEEELTAEQIAITETSTKMNSSSGYLAQEAKAMTELRGKKVIQWAITTWESNNPKEHRLLERLKLERETTARGEDGNPKPTWAGLPLHNQKLRSSLIARMNESELKTYKSNLGNWESLCLERGVFISGLVKSWKNTGSSWPYALMEDWDDETFSNDSGILVGTQSNQIAWDKDTNAVLQNIQFDIISMKSSI